MCNAMSPQIALRGKNALSSAVASIAALFLMALWIGGAQEFSGIVLGFLPLFLLISFVALVFGAFLCAKRIRWSLLIGALSGVAGGTAIIWRVMSQI